MADAGRVTWLLLLIGLFCQKSHSEDLTAATSVTVAKDAPVQAVTVSTAKVPTVVTLTTIQAVVAPVTVKVQTVAATNVPTTKATSALPTLRPSSAVITTPKPKTTPAPTPAPTQPQPQQSQTNSVPSATSTVKMTTLAPTDKTAAPKITLPVPTTGNPKVSIASQTRHVTVTPTVKATTGHTAASQKTTAQTTVAALKTTRRQVGAGIDPTARTTATIARQTTTAGTTKPTTAGQRTSTVASIPASLWPSTIATTVATPTVTSPKMAPATTTTVSYPRKFSYSLNKGHEKEEEKELVEVCKRLMGNLKDGNCTLTWSRHKGKLIFDCVEINGRVKTALATQYYEEITKKPTDNKTLIAILASCGALLIMIIILAVCASHHRKPYGDNQHLTEELHTVENGYHDNPTLEVMEVQPEMHEKKVALNGDFNEGWIVPMDNLLKDDTPDEEDTHL
ncbi:podocalyxin [Stigmatopora argus]